VDGTVGTLAAHSTQARGRACLLFTTRASCAQQLFYNSFSATAFLQQLFFNTYPSTALLQQHFFQ
jgi:hypothetical protein